MGAGEWFVLMLMCVSFWCIVCSHHHLCRWVGPPEAPLPTTLSPIIAVSMLFVHGMDILTLVLSVFVGVLCVGVWVRGRGCSRLPPPAKPSHSLSSFPFQLLLVVYNTRWGAYGGVCVTFGVVVGRRRELKFLM